MDVNEIMARLGSSVRVRALAGDESLFRRGDPALNMFGLLSGAARLTRDTAEGARIVVHRAQPGSLFAEASLFSDVYHCDGEAQAGSQVAVFPKTAVRDLMQRDPDFAFGFCHRLAGQVQYLRTHVELRAIRSAENRVLAALSLRLDGDARSVTLGTTWKTFAQEIGLTHEALYRALKQLEQAGRIRRAGTCVTLTGNGG